MRNVLKKEIRFARNHARKMSFQNEFVAEINNYRFRFSTSRLCLYSDEKKNLLLLLYIMCKKINLFKEL